LIDQDREVAEELLAGLPPIRWPDPITPAEEMLAAVVIASPEAGERIVVAMHVLLHRAVNLDQLVGELDREAIRFGQSGDGETCAALLDICDRIREWRCDRG
jgi:hypothetical protein